MGPAALPRAMTKMRLNCERLMLSGPLPSGISRLSVLPSKRMRRSNADSMLLASSAPVKNSVARSVQKIERGIAGRRHRICSFSQAARARLHLFEMSGKEVIGAGMSTRVLGLAAESKRMFQLHLGGELVLIAAEKELGERASGEKRVFVGTFEAVGRKSEQGKRAKRWAVGGADDAQCAEAAIAMAAPKLNPTRMIGKLYSLASQLSAATTSADSACPSCTPSLMPVPRKLKRSTGQRRSHSGAFRTFMA